MNIEQLIKTVPQVVAQPSSHLSNRYKYIPTLEVVKDVLDLGFEIHSAKGKKSENGLHEIVFSNSNALIDKNRLGGIHPRIHLINSHDGLSSFKFMSGLYRLVCSNGLVLPLKVGEHTLAQSMTIRHTQYTFDELQGVIKELLNNMDNNIAPIYKMQETSIDREQSINFVKESLLLRNRITPDKVREFLANIPEETYDYILEPKRVEDASNDVWATFNIVQEKMLEGGFKLNKRQVRPLNDFRRTNELNQQLFAKALDLI